MDKTEDEPLVLIKYLNNEILEIRLNNPSKLNSVNIDMLKLIHSKIQPFVASEISNKNLNFKKYISEPIEDNQANGVKVILFTATGSKSFCSGGDLVTLYRYKSDFDSLSAEIFYDYELTCCYYLAQLNEITLISIWNGYVMGGGVGLSVNAAIRIATENTIFAMPECGIGLYPDVGGCFFLPRIMNGNKSLGLYYGLTGEWIKGESCARLGVATHYVKSEKLDELKSALIILENKDCSTVRELVDKFADVVYSPCECIHENLEIIENIFQFDGLSNILSRLDKCNKDFALKIKEKIRKNSPQSMSLFYNLCEIALSYSDISSMFVTDKLIFNKLFLDTEFQEGIRATVIIKDKTPNWKYKSVSEIGEDYIKNEYLNNL
jgi:3-hydroxyisobutyryl-CoA hydrolase